MTIFLVLSFSACASKPTTPAPSSAKAVDRRIRRLEKELLARKTLIEDLRERNLVLERRVHGDVNVVGDNSQVPVPFQPSAALSMEGADGAVPVGDGEISTPAVLQGAPPKAASIERVVNDAISGAPAATATKFPAKVMPVALPAVESVGGSRTGEQILYSKILETYRNHRADDMQKTLQLLLKNYPDSIFADNALYMAGLLAFESGDQTQALKYMSRVINDYPRGNKTVAALFAKASIEKQLKRFGEARQAFQKVRVLFPGSPEAARVAFELKLLDVAAKQRREI